MSEGFLGEIRLFPYNRVPRGWHVCDGTTLAIAQYAALFALLSNRYGGDGTKTFCLPDLRGRVPVHLDYDDITCGQNGAAFGQESVTLTAATMPPHAHTVTAVGTDGDKTVPLSAVPAAVAGGGAAIYGAYPGKNSQVALSATTIASGGGGKAHENRQPTMAMQYCIVTAGIFPTRT